MEEDGRTLIITESLKNETSGNATKQRRILNATEINGEQALLNSKNNGTMSSKVVNGSI